MQKIQNSLLFRIFLGITAPLILVGGILFLYRFGSPFPCFFHLITGLYCPGCGAGRAVTALVHGDFLTAFRNNILFLPAFAFVGWYFFQRYLQLVFHKNFIWMPPITVKTYQITMFFLLGYWVLRNLPWFPFTLLAPIS